MSIKIGCIDFHVAFVVPGDDAQRMEDFLKTHEAFMRVKPIIYLEIKSLLYRVTLCYEAHAITLDPSSVGERRVTCYTV